MVKMIRSMIFATLFLVTVNVMAEVEEVLVPEAHVEQANVEVAQAQIPVVEEVNAEVESEQVATELASLDEEVLQTAKTVLDDAPATQVADATTAEEEFDLNFEDFDMEEDEEAI